MKTNHDIACILAELSPGDRAHVLDRLSPTERERIRGMLADIDEPTDREAAIQRFLSIVDASDTGSAKPESTAIPNVPVEAAIPDLRSLAPKTIADALSNDEPRTIAAAVQGIPSCMAANVLVEFPKDDQPSIIAAIIESTEIRPEILGDVIRGLRQRLITTELQVDLGITATPEELNSGSAATYGLERYSQILADASPEVRKELLNRMNGTDSVAKSA